MHVSAPTVACTSLLYGFAQSRGVRGSRCGYRYFGGVATSFMSLHVASYTECFPTTSVGAFIGLFTRVTV